MVALNEQFTFEKSSLGSKNRVGDFFVRNGDRVGLEPPVNRLGIGEKYDASPRMVSGHSKFANGAVTTAFSRAFNDKLHE